VREDRLVWDQKHAADIQELSGSPSSYLAAWLPYLPKGRALDLAAGCGRHAIYLAQRGYRVDALDISLVALARLMHQVRAQKLPVRAAAIDLDDVTLPPATYDLIVNSYYLNRPLLPQLPRALVPGGALLMETPMYDPASDRPSEIAHRVGPRELVRVFSDLNIAHYEEIPASPPRRKRPLCRMVALRSPRV
jgi:SAM-dependent methyltransferase